MPSKEFKNRLNNLDPKEWLQFQKSWFIHSPPARKKEVLLHPAKFPETLVQEFIEFFTKEDQVVLDPMVGTGSTIVAAMRAGRNSYGIELNPRYAEIARNVIDDEYKRLAPESNRIACKVITGDASEICKHVTENSIPVIDYVISSPPYWNMLRVKGSETQRKRRARPDLDVIYSDDPNDLGNINDYDDFIERLTNIIANLKKHIRKRAYLTIIVKNIKKGGIVYPLAWDLASSLGKFYTLKDERIWCQDNIRLAPYGLGNAWVSNTFHHYCLQFRNE